MEKAKSEFTKYERQDVKLHEDIKHMKAREKKLEASIKAEEKKVTEMERNVKISNEDIEKYEKELASLEKALKKEEADLETVCTFLLLLLFLPTLMVTIGIRGSKRSHGWIECQTCQQTEGTFTLEQEAQRGQG